MLQPSAASCRRVSNSLRTACGVSTEVGSSRISSLRDLQQAADDLDPLALAHGQGVHQPARIDGQAVALGDLDDALREAGQIELAGQRQGDVLRHGERLEQGEVLEHHADAQLARVRRVGDGTGLPSQQHLARVRTDDAVDDLHEGGFAGAVFAHHGVDLAGHHGRGRRRRWRPPKGRPCAFP